MPRKYVLKGKGPYAKHDYTSIEQAVKSVKEDNDSTAPKTPLVSGQQRYGSQSNTFTSKGESPKSARKYKPNDKEKEFLSSVDMLSTADMQKVHVSSLDKTFQDQGKVFDEIFQQFQSLKSNTNNFKKYFVEETAGIPVMSKCVEILVERCGAAKIEVERRKYSVSLKYDYKDIMRNSTENPQQVIHALELYNDLNKNIQKILDRGPEVQKSVTMLLEDEENMRKEVTKTDFTEGQGPEAMKACLDNIHKLRKMNSQLKTINKHTEKANKEVMEASKAFFKEEI